MMMMMMMKPIESDSSRLLSSSLETLWLFLSVLERTIIPRSLLSLSLSLSLSKRRRKRKEKGALLKTTRKEWRIRERNKEVFWVLSFSDSSTKLPLIRKKIEEEKRKKKRERERERDTQQFRVSNKKKEKKRGFRCEVFFVLFQEVCNTYDVLRLIVPNNKER